jgi:hypothetical protein
LRTMQALIILTEENTQKTESVRSSVYE